MRTRKAGLIAVAGIAIGSLTLRRLRTHRQNAADEDPPLEAARSEAAAAGQHASAAVSHARGAGENVVEAVKAEVDVVDDQEGGELAAAPVRRLRRVGKGWIRR